MGIVLRISDGKNVDEVVMGPLWDKEATVRGVTLLFPTLEIQLVPITQESILCPQRMCVLSTSHYFRSTLTLKESIARFSSEIRDAQTAMREAGTMTRPFQDLGTKDFILRFDAANGWNGT